MDPYKLFFDANTPEYKRCSKCGEWKEKKYFSKDKNGKDGLDHCCKECRKEYNKEYYQNNKDKIKECRKEYYQNNKDKVNEYSKEWYQNNKDKIKEYYKEYYKDNKDKIKEYSKEYNKEYYSLPMRWDSKTKMVKNVKKCKEVRKSKNNTVECKCDYCNEWFEPTGLKLTNLSKPSQHNIYCSEECVRSALEDLQTSEAEREILNFTKSICKTKIVNNDRSTIINPNTENNLELDIYFPELNKAIEFNGEYWHSFPQAIEKDKIKKEQCRKNNIDLLVIEEENWINNKDTCLQLIENFIGE